MSKIWLITGASQGLGLAMVKYLLAQGQKVVATTRDRDKFDKELLGNHNLEVLALDLNSEEEVHAAVARIITTYGTIDVLVNNAGHGLVGAIEELSETEISQVFAINVEASLRMIRNVLPVMRHSGKGHIISLSSTAGLSGAAGWGIYNASKHAVEGFSEALFYELKDLGIKVTIIEPGSFRTGFLDESLAVAANVISDYDGTVRLFKKALSERNGKQPGDPDKAAAVICEVTEMEEPPLRLLLGSDALERAKRKIALLQTDFNRMEAITISTDFEI